MIRRYGQGRIRAAVIHGGPGAPGYMAPVARELGKSCGVIEPIQSKTSLDGQIEELHSQIIGNCDGPVCLIGSSWGATLALLYAARFQGTANKVILIGSCVYDAASSEAVKKIRFDRMTDETQRKFEKISSEMEDAESDEKNILYSKLVDCFFKSDTFDPVTEDLEIIECQADVNKLVWANFKKIRDNQSELREIFSRIAVPVINIHGDYDSHIIEGIHPYLESCISDVKLHKLKNCGHYPWIERQARDQFFQMLQHELS